MAIAASAPKYADTGAVGVIASIRWLSTSAPLADSMGTRWRLGVSAGSSTAQGPAAPQSRRSVEHDRLLPRSLSSTKVTRPANESHRSTTANQGISPRRPRPPGPYRHVAVQADARQTAAGLRVIALHTEAGTGSDTDGQTAALVIARTRSERDDWSPTRS
jgi:uncharacterized iron-regulated membrane protein